MICPFCSGMGHTEGGLPPYRVERICKRCDGKGKIPISEIRPGEHLRGYRLRMSAQEADDLRNWVARELMPVIIVSEKGGS